MIDMKRKVESDRATLMAPEMTEEYPYGLRISLGNEELKKLGIAELPAIDTEMKLTALVCVTSVSSSEYQSGEPHKHVELQIEQMTLVPAKEEDNTTAKALYPSMA